MADIRNIRPFGTVPPDKIKRVINGKLTEIKKAYRCINGKLVVVWDIGKSPHNPTIMELIYIPKELSGGEAGKYYAYFFNLDNEAIGGFVDWGDGTTEIINSSSAHTHAYPDTAKKTVKIDAAITYLKDNKTGFPIFPSNVISVKLPETLKTIGTYAFQNCAYIEHFDFANVEEIKANAFYNAFVRYADNPTYSIDIDLKHVKTIGEMAFYYGKGIINVNMPECEEIGVNAFQGCSNLETVTMGKIKTIRSGVFQGCSKIESIEIPSTIEYIQPKDNSWGINGAFYYMQGLKTIRIHKPQDSIAGSPWGASAAVNIIWD